MPPETEPAVTEEHPQRVLAIVRGEPKALPEAPERGVLTFPWLVAVEGLAAVACLTVLVVVSLVAMAPLEEIANPSLTPNPAKAPWYFLGLQELLVYFDPWIAGVVVPGIIVVGLMLLPYVDLSPRTGIGRFAWRLRKFDVVTFALGIALWFILIGIGQFCRGPAWEWYWPWESWAVEKEASGGLVSLSRPIGIALVGVYVVVGAAVGAYVRRRRCPDADPIRYALTVLLTLLALSIPLKIMLRLLFGVKYVLQTPWLNI